MLEEPKVLAPVNPGPQDVVAIEKPAGWVVHAAMKREQFDVRAWLAKQPGLPKGLEPLHRLDRDTSGVCLWAADPAVRAKVGALFQESKVKKTYMALVFGRVHQKGVIRTPLAPDNGGDPQPAITRYRLAEALGGFSLLRISPETGRKHQIRRHLLEIRHPVVGDTRYPLKAKIRVPAYPGRLWLHCTRIELPDGQVFTSPLPELLEKHLEVLRVGQKPPEVVKPSPLTPGDL